MAQQKSFIPGSYYCRAKQEVSNDSRIMGIGLSKPKYPSFAWGTFASACGLHVQNWSSWMSSGYRSWTKRKQKSCSIFWSLFGVPEVKGGLGQVGKNDLHWKVALDVLLGPAMFVRVEDHWLNDCNVIDSESYTPGRNKISQPITKNNSSF